MVKPGRSFPVHFQRLEDELDPVKTYLSGRLLNAGAGVRDIGPFLSKCGATSVTRYDLWSSDPQVVVGPLEAMPFEDGSFDAVLCNAVLEHVHGVEEAMHELARVVREGGHVVVAIPFLQPYHPCPGDFRRYTADGLADLGSQAGLDLVEMRPVHTIAQTVGWILWEDALERGGRLWRLLVWFVVLVWTRLSQRTNRPRRHSANTFQAVFRRPTEDNLMPWPARWRDASVPPACSHVPTMLVPDELRLLHYLDRQCYRGIGAIVDAGAFLGGSTVALASGVRANHRARRTSPAAPIHTFDRFKVESYTLGRYFPEHTPIGSSFREAFDRNTARFADLVEVHAGDILEHEWTGGPIEILFVDIAKTCAVGDWVIWQFFRHLIPGRSIVVQQDYLYPKGTGWLHIAMEFYADSFEYICDTEVNSVVFLSAKAIPRDVLQRHTVERLSREERAALADRAADRFTGQKRDTILAAKEDFLNAIH
jgi:hypothetical protein